MLLLGLMLFAGLGVVNPEQSTAGQAGTINTNSVEVFEHPTNLTVLTYVSSGDRVDIFWGPEWEMYEVRIPDGTVGWVWAEFVDPDGSGEASSSSDESGEVGSSGGAVLIPGAFAYKQQRGLSCEYASLAIATGMLGDWISEYDFDPVVPLSANPHWGYRGYIDGTWGNTTDYGVYAEPLAPALQQFGFQGDVFYGGPADLMAQIDMGRPTLVWIGARGESGSFYEWTPDGTRYQLTPFYHVVVIYGYDDGGVYVSDPGNGALTYWDWASFKAMWSVMDGMSLAVHW